MNKYPVFEEYEDHWPINDFVRNHLKTRKAAIKNEKLEKMAAEMEKQKATEDARKVGDQEVGNAANATARVSKTGNVAHPRHGRK
jgi:DNA mismatch repair ATPase MutL